MLCPVSAITSGVSDSFVHLPLSPVSDSTPSRPDVTEEPDISIPAFRMASTAWRTVFMFFFW